MSQADLFEKDDSNLRVILLLVLSVSMVSSASILIRFSQSHPLVIVFWRTLFGAIVMASIGVLRRDFQKFDDTKVRSNWPWLILIGVILSLHFSTWFTSLFLTTVAASVVLVNTSPIFTGIISTLVLGESLRRKSWIGVVIAVTGAVFLAWNDWETLGAGALTGDILALLSSFFLALYFIGGRKYARGIPITVYTTIVYVTAAFVALVMCMMSGITVFVLDPIEIAIFVALAIFPTALGHSVNNYLLTLVPAYVVSSAVLGEPIGATILAAIFLSEIPAPLTFVGFVIILIGIAIVLFDLAREEQSELSLNDS